MMKRITAKMFTCPECGACPGHDCKGSRIPGANTLGGGWGGPPDRQRPHDARYAVAREEKAKQARHAKLRQAGVDPHKPVSEMTPSEIETFQSMRRSSMKTPKPFSGSRFRQNEARCPSGEDPCALCGKGVDPDGARLVRVVDGGSRFAASDEVVDEAGDMGYYAVGPSCYRENREFFRSIGVENIGAGEV